MNDDIFCKACEIFQLIENDVYTFKYMEIDDQIEGIIYYVNTYAIEIINIDKTIDDTFIEQIYQNCHNAYMDVNYPYIQGESELSYIEELRETQTFKMIESVIKDLYEYYQK
jgi:hypothetical protein